MERSDNSADSSRGILGLIDDSVGAGVPGLSAAVCSSHRTWTFTSGVSDVHSRQPIEKTHLFGIGSITKVFVAVVVLQLVEEGKLRLSDTVGALLDPSVYRDIVDAEDATVARLLSHEAGIDSWEDDPTWIRSGRGIETDPSHIWSKTEPLDYIRRSKKTAPEPGKWYYSNTNYTLLGLIIEKAAQSPAEVEIRRRILTPLGLRHTYLEGFERPPSEGSPPSRYHWATDAFRETAGVSPSFPAVSDRLIDCTSSNLSTEWTAGGILSSATDLVAFGAALRDGKLLRPESLAVMTEWRPATNGEEMGHGLFRMKRPDGRRWLGHFGGVLGFTAALWWEEGGDTVVSVLSNVGTMHAGNVPSSAGHVVVKSNLLELASELTGAGGHAAPP
ncbi:D-Ala-D-Ala carboxypeptidase [Purpureocillium lavendulum]|uniref:D-Ala-D-Ala carboxypeptidase n=1 Tax=Purpureocillium lavendulum TaxID=1247861 RepID=A0AB34FRH9_9HYPO|nr:D-Ala-D-Ala carboxypeptidase [Purpureocillium lavendulum]